MAPPAPGPRPLVSLGDHWYAWTEDLPAGAQLRGTRASSPTGGSTSTPSSTRGR
ncbi:MAG: hypothetical protein R2702_14950 [Acidimicrobiales bacterium]